MPITTTVDQAARLVQFSVSGGLDTTEMIAAVDEALRQLQPSVGYNVLTDHRALSAPATPEQVKTLIAMLAERGQAFRGARCAVIVATEASYGMMRLMAVHAESIGIHVGVFRAEDKARDFIKDRP